MAYAWKSKAGMLVLLDGRADRAATVAPTRACRRAPPAARIARAGGGTRR